MRLIKHCECKLKGYKMLTVLKQCHHYNYYIDIFENELNTF